eukprot:GHVH01000890.1.p1 GENE.GHVH01000890.1~~GHVH01000890.1.p1  ORF type:complete len:167 (+),score=16.33 GHVH01000890.1:57-557(+)
MVPTSFVNWGIEDRLPTSIRRNSFNDLIVNKVTDQDNQLHPVQRMGEQPATGSTSNPPIPLLDKELAYDESCRLLSASKMPMLTFSNSRIDNKEMIRTLRQLLKNGSLVLASPGSPAFLDTIFELKKDGAYRLVVPGNQDTLQRRNLYPPRIPFIINVVHAISSVT